MPDKSKKDLKLEEIQDKLIEADERLMQAKLKFLPIQLEYEHKRNKLYMQSNMATLGLKEAEVNEILYQEGIKEKYEVALLNVKNAYQRKDTIHEISRVLRSLSYDTY